MSEHDPSRSAPRSEARAAVLRVLAEADTPLSPKQVAERLGRDPNAVTKLMWTMVRKGELQQQGYGRYALVETLTDPSASGKSFAPSLTEAADFGKSSDPSLTETEATGKSWNPSLTESLTTATESGKTFGKSLTETETTGKTWDPSLTEEEGFGKSWSPSLTESLTAADEDGKTFGKTLTEDDHTWLESDHTSPIISHTSRPPLPVVAAGIAAALTARAQWVCWREEARDGKPTKVPINARAGGRASSADPATWTTFAAALAASPRYAGVGFVFSAADPFIGIDLDGCRDPESGALAAWAQAWIARLDTYAEVSPSGTGVKLFARGRLPEGAWHKINLKGAPSFGGKRASLEIYDRGRFFTLTGRALADSPLVLNDCQAALDALQARYAKPKGPKPAPRPALPLNLDDAALLDSARRAVNGAQFAALFDRGDLSAHNGDHSVADLDLCGRLCFYCQGDEGRIDRLFRESHLIREKWDERRGETTYGQMTIAKAVSGCGKYYTPGLGKPPELTDSDAPRRATTAPTNGRTSETAVEDAPRPADERVTNQVEPASLVKVIETFKRWLFLPDDGHIKVSLGAYAANRMPGDPVWLMLVGAPGSGKTEALSALCALPHVTANSSLSGESALLSGTSKKDKSREATGGLLREIGAFGVLVLKDFTSILQMKHDQRAPLLAALREVYDGFWTRRLGVDGGRKLEWAGKLGLIAGCTPTIDSHHAVIGAMGERFAMYRLPVADEKEQARRAMANYGQEEQMRKELAAVVAALLAGVDLSGGGSPLVGEEEARMVHLAILAVRCRSAVERCGRTREILLIPDPEAPGRLAGVLSRLLRGMIAVGVERSEAWRLIAKVATDSMPALRWAAFLHAAEQPPHEWTPTAAFAVATRHPRVTVHRALEDLHAHRVMDRAAAGWALSKWARENYDPLRPLFQPEETAKSVPTQARCPEKPPQGVLGVTKGRGGGEEAAERESGYTLSGGFSGHTLVQPRKQPPLEDAAPPANSEALQCGRCGRERAPEELVADPEQPGGVRCLDGGPCANRQVIAALTRPAEPAPPAVREARI